MRAFCLSFVIIMLAPYATTSAVEAPHDRLLQQFKDARKLQDAGDYLVAEPAFRECLKFSKSNFGPADERTAYIQYELGKCIVGLQRPHEAYDFFEKALATWQASTEWKKEVDTLAEMGRIRWILGDYPSAAKLAWEAISLSRRNGQPDHKITPIFNGLAAYAYYEHDFERAGELLNYARKLVGRSHQPMNESSVDYWQGELARQRGDYAEAERLHTRALVVRQNQQVQSAQSIGWSLMALGSLSQLQRKYTPAEQYFRDAFDAMKRVGGQDYEEVAEIKLHQAEIAAARGQWTNAFSMIGDARRIQVRYARTTLKGLPEELQLGFLSRDALKYRGRALTLAVNAPRQAPLIRQSLEWVLNSKALSQEVMADRGHVRSGTSWTTVEQVRSNLAPDSVLIEIAKVDESETSSAYFAWLLWPDGRVQLKRLGEANDLERSIESYRKAMATYDQELRYDITEKNAEALIHRPLASVARLTIDPIRAAIAESKHWMISPDGLTWLVPWAALPISKDRYVVESHRVTHYVSGREIRREVEVGSATGRGAVFANPTFDLDSSRQSVARGTGAHRLLDLATRIWEELDWSEEEVNNILPFVRQWLSGIPHVYVRDRALEGIVKGLRRPKLLVLSTHGFTIHDQSPTGKTPSSGKNGISTSNNPLLRCGLALAGANNSKLAAGRGRDDGILNGLEIAAMDLHGTDLVVLSACDTIVGTIIDGEGIAGLRQAFQLAGARTVAATLWKVPDQETSDLMKSFWRQLASVQDASTALRQAQLEQINHRRARSDAAHPYYWAAFTITSK